MLNDASSRWRPLIGPAFSFMIQCSAELMAQPHSEQSGSPPNTQGATRVRRCPDVPAEVAEVTLEAKVSAQVVNRRSQLRIRPTYLCALQDHSI